MECLVCKLKFDAAAPIVADPEMLKHGMSVADAELLARRQRAAEQNAWQHVIVTLDGREALSGHVCPKHANAESLSLAGSDRK